MPNKEMNDYVTIHGDKWKSVDIRDAVEWALGQDLEKYKWFPRAALISKGKISEYVGQKFNPEYTELVEDGWEHDHCEICWWSLHESDDPDSGEGYSNNGRSWLCTECYEQFIAPNA